MQIPSTPFISPTANSDLVTFGIPADGNAEDVAQSFEAVFASQLIKEMRSTLSEGFFGSEQSDVLGGLFDLHMGQAMAEGGGLGIKELVLSHWQANNET